jgi:hypothetical protein
MKHTFSHATPSQNSRTPVDTDVYIQWLATAEDAIRFAGVDASSVTASNVPRCDAEAISQGLRVYHEIRARTHANSRGLPDHAFDDRRRAATGVALAPRRGVPRWLTFGAATIVLGAAASFAMHRINSPHPSALASAGSSLVETTASEASPSPSPNPVQFKNTQTSRMERTQQETKLRHVVRRRAASEPVHTAIQTEISAPDQTTLPHPETCPPGVDRLGCPGIGTGQRMCPYGYRLSGQTCEKVSVPLHAHYEAVGFGWECDAGYLQTDAGCTRLHVPPNAHLDFTGRAWVCDSGFVRSGEGCI